MLDIARVSDIKAFGEELAKLPQVDIETGHLFHAGVYARTIHVPAGTAMTNVHIIIPTILIISGDIMVADGAGAQRFTGYHVLECKAPRQNAFYAVADTEITMLFATNAKTIEEAENEFTDEPELLGSRRKI